MTLSAFFLGLQLATSDEPPPVPETRLFTSLAGNEFSPAWSSDGRQLAFTALNAEQGGDLYIQLLDDEMPRRLTRHPYGRVEERASDIMLVKTRYAEP